MEKEEEITQQTTQNFEFQPKKEYYSNQIIIWTSDFHISTVYDIKHILSSFDVKIIDKSLSGHCHLTNTCQTDLQIINRENGIDLSPCPNRLRTRFYQYYKNNPEFNSVDAFLCTHASSMCELYLPFGKPIIVVASTRFEIGRHDPLRWNYWITNLQKIASHEENIVAANNEYDREYIRYFTGLSSDKVHLLRSLCDYPGVTYHPIRHEILIGPSRGANPHIAHALLALNSDPHHPLLVFDNQPLQLHLLRDVYPHYEYVNLTHHPAIILVPYQVSFMFFFELYSMSIPMFVPSPDLLTSWHLSYGLLSERTWDRVYGSPKNRSALPRHQNWSTNKSSSHFNYDPNNEFQFQAIKEWIQFSDFYRFPHIIQFDSLDHLRSQLSRVTIREELREVSRQMKGFHERTRVGEGRREWKEILRKIEEFKQKRGAASSLSSSLSSSSSSSSSFQISSRSDINSALRDVYGLELADDCVNQIEVEKRKR